jgi:hypothetical protein
MVWPMYFCPCGATEINMIGWWLPRARQESAGGVALLPHAGQVWSRLPCRATGHHQGPAAGGDGCDEKWSYRLPYG